MRAELQPWRRWCLAAWVVGATCLLLSPGSSEPSNAPIEGLDKLGHAALFLPAGYLGGLLPLWSLGGLVSFGGVTELAQHFVPGRSPEVLDVVADLVGAAIGVALAWWRGPGS